jgi:hypothetical protein
MLLKLLGYDATNEIMCTWRGYLPSIALALNLPEGKQEKNTKLNIANQGSRYVTTMLTFILQPSYSFS